MITINIYFILAYFILFFIFGFLAHVVYEMRPVNNKVKDIEEESDKKVLKKYTVYAKHPLKGDLSSLLSKPAYRCTFETFGDGWLANKYHEPVEVEIEAYNAKEACDMLVKKLPKLYFGKGDVEFSEERYALFAVYLDEEFRCYCRLSKY